MPSLRRYLRRARTWCTNLFHRSATPDEPSDDQLYDNLFYEFFAILKTEHEPSRRMACELFPPPRPLSTYNDVRSIGKGSFGKVRLVNKVIITEPATAANNNRYKQRTLPAVVKTIKAADAGEYPPTEAVMLAYLRRSPNVVKLLELGVIYCPSTRNIAKYQLAMEFCEHNLRGLLECRAVVLQAPELSSVLHQLLSGVAYLHDRLILHRDLKLENIFLTSAGVLKLGDFGLSIMVAEVPHSHVRTTPGWAAPEVVFTKRVYGLAADVWSVGLIAYTTMTMLPLQAMSKFAFYLRRYRRQQKYSMNVAFEKAQAHLGNYVDTIVHNNLVDHPMHINLVLSMLQVIPQARLTAREALEHTFFTQHPPDMAQLRTRLAATNGAYCHVNSNEQRSGEYDLYTDDDDDDDDEEEVVVVEEFCI